MQKCSPEFVLAFTKTILQLRIKAQQNTRQTQLRKNHRLIFGVLCCIIVLKLNLCTSDTIPAMSLSGMLPSKLCTDSNTFHTYLSRRNLATSQREPDGPQQPYTTNSRVELQNLTGSFRRSMIPMYQTPLPTHVVLQYRRALPPWQHRGYQIAT